MSTPTGQQPAQLNIELSVDLEATYSNMALISHSASELIIDFARVMPNMPKGKVYSRVVMTPMNAKLLYFALADNLQKFEAKYGEVKIPDAPLLIDRSKGFTG